LAEREEQQGRDRAKDHTERFGNPNAEVPEGDPLVEPPEDGIKEGGNERHRQCPEDLRHGPELERAGMTRRVL
jgi:hypothetical protein